MPIWVEGFLLQASLILALGAQNIFVLESGLKRHRHFLVAFVSALCDCMLLLLGVLGAATIFIQIPLLKQIFGVLGCAFLLYYGFKKLKEAGHELPVARVGMKPTLRATLLATFAFSLLNPHVYLDTVVLVGGYATRFPLINDRLQFGLGAGICSFVFFFGLVLLASSLNRFLQNPKTMRIVSAVSGIILIAFCFRLGMDVLR